MRISALLAVFLLTTAPALAQELRFSARTADCAAPTPFPNCIGGSFVDQGTTAGANDTVDQVNIGCFGVTSVPGPDVIYSFNSIVAFGSPTIDIRVTPALGYDVAIYVLDQTSPGCPAGTGNAVTNCVTGANAGGP
ncbi:MAG TPA: hypothetical protein VN783_16885, partial [Thermoanaerobaculia bacterium]|nr:hypothetical protein [Thermoanaerobaculia bacterium]